MQTRAPVPMEDGNLTVHETLYLIQHFASLRLAVRCGDLSCTLRMLSALKC